MTATLDETLAGHDMEGGEVFCDDLYNNLKNHWRANYGGEPCGSAGLEHLQPGMIISDEYDDRLYHITLVSGCPCSEMLQACVPLSDDVYHGYGYDWDAMVGYDELVNDALILGIPVTDKRGLIICDQADVIPDITVAPYSLGTLTQPTIYMLDADLDSYLGIGHQGDDLPGIWAIEHLYIQHDANGDVIFFGNSEDGDNRLVYIYGWDSGGAPGLRYGSFQINNSGAFLINAEEQGALVQGGTVVARWFADRVQWLDGKLAEWGSTNDASIEYCEATNDAWIFGIPCAADKRGLIFCDRADIAADMTGLLPFRTLPTITGVDADLDSYWELGWGADDEPQLLLGGVADTLKTNAIMEYTRQGSFFQWTYQGDLVDDASFTLPAFTDACWGFIQAGANEEYALFSVDDDGDVTLISNSANVVANADTDGKLCIGTAATQEGLVIRNRLDATKNINLIIWYS